MKQNFQQNLVRFSLLMLVVGLSGYLVYRSSKSGSCSVCSFCGKCSKLNSCSQPAAKEYRVVEKTSK